jgi:anti-sigma-K factor RskA
MTNGHPTREEDFDLYVLGALDAEEQHLIESHVARCAECARKVAEAHGRVALASFAVPRVDASLRVKEQLMARIRAERESSPPSTLPAPREAEPAVRRRGTWSRWWAAVPVPVGVALAVATVLLWSQNERLNRELANQRNALASLQSERAEAHHVRDLLAAPDTVVVRLAPMPGMPEGTGRVTYSEHMGMLMYDGTLGPAPRDKSYQLWLVPQQGNPINAGVFNPQAGRTDHWMIEIPPGVTPRAFAVTLEPAGGVSRPTGPEVLVGAVSQG